jgi:SAM-dependent methyltransferase
MTNNSNDLQVSSVTCCPICGSRGGEPLLTLDCGNLDGSTLYPSVLVLCCPQCHHCFNAITTQESEGLINYYNTEYAPANLGAAESAGDRPGSTGGLTTIRYEQLYDILTPHLEPDHAILDVGCAQGGFLDFLWSKGHRKLAGVDMTDPYVRKAREKNRYRIEKGTAEALPFEQGSFDVVVLEQVLEHLIDPVRAVREAKRVLRNDGLLCIGVPDAERYHEYYFFDFYWLLLREHVQHFDLFHLDALARKEGFELCNHRATALAVMSDRMVMPNLSAVFQLRQGSNTKNRSLESGALSRTRMTEYISAQQAHRSEKMRRIEALAASHRPVYIWGIGREFLYLYESAGLRRCRIAALVDANPFKQRSCSVQGAPVADPACIVRDSTTESVLVVTAIAHEAEIIKRARSMGFKGDIFKW